MHQLALDIRTELPRNFASFVSGANAEMLARLRALAAPKSFETLYVWGPGGSGRTHLLCATREAALEQERAVSFATGAEVSDGLWLPRGGLLIVDDIDTLTDEGQSALFRAFNTARLIGMAMLLSGPAPPAQLALREDLRSRVSSALVFEVKPLSDEDKARTLERHAAARGFELTGEVIDYLLSRGRRDLPSLLAVLDALDRASLEKKRHVTIPLLRKVLAGNARRS
jgi:DnaA family protein